MVFCCDSVCGKRKEENSTESYFVCVLYSDFDHTNRKNKTPLFNAICECGEAAIVELQAAGAPMNAANLATVRYTCYKMLMLRLGYVHERVRYPECVYALIEWYFGYSMVGFSLK